MTLTLTRGARIAGGAITAAAAVAALTVVASSSPATASAPALSFGHGARIAHNTDYVGNYRSTVHGKTVFIYCINPGKRSPRTVTLSSVAQIKGHSVTATRQMAEVLTLHGNTTKAATAEAVSQALNYLAGNRKDVTRRAKYLPKSVQKQAMAFVSEAGRNVGPFRLTIRPSTAALPGQTGTATVTLSGGHGGKAAVVRLSGTKNVAVPGAVRTNAAGRGSFRYRTTGTGAVRITGAVSGLPATTVLQTHPGPGEQEMVSATTPTSVSAAAGYTGRVSGFSQRYSCDTTCNGHPAVTLSACAPASTMGSRFEYRVSGKVRGIVAFAASGKRVCKNLTLTLADRDTVTGAWRFRVSAKAWSSLLPAAGTFTVDCPPAPPVAITMSYDCAAASVTVAMGRQAGGTLAAFTNTSKHAMAMSVRGAATGNYVTAPGASSTSHTFALKCGTHAEISVRSAVQRAGGGWNYGKTVQVIAP